jgi:hypothetical protein
MKAVVGSSEVVINVAVSRFDVTRRNVLLLMNRIVISQG